MIIMSYIMQFPPQYMTVMVMQDFSCINRHMEGLTDSCIGEKDRSLHLDNKNIKINQ